MSSEAFEDLDTMATLLKEMMLDGRHELLDDEDSSTPATYNTTALLGGGRHPS